MVKSFLQYLQYEKRYSPHTTTAYENDLIQFRDFLSHAYQLEDITQADFHLIRSWIVSMVEEKNSPVTINRKIATLKTFYKFLKKREAIMLNPMLKIKALKTAKAIPHFIEETSLNRLLDSFPFTEDFVGQRDKTVLELFYGTGMRLSELIGLKENNINFYDKSLKVLGKRNKERIIPIHEGLLNSIRKYIDYKKKEFPSSEFLIVNDSGMKSYPMFIYRIVRKYLGDAAVPGKKSPHILRHTFATHLLNKGADLNAIKDLLGHSSLAATQVYTHNSLEKLKLIFEQAHPKA